MFGSLVVMVVVAFAALLLCGRSIQAREGHPTGGQVGPSRQAAGAVSGFVLDALTQRPVADAIVVLARAGRTGRSQLTDESGRFALENIETGVPFELRVSKAGYLPGTYDGRVTARSSGNTAESSQRGWVRDLRIELLKFGSISGQILDEDNEPLSGVLVRAIGKIPIAGEEHLAAGPVAITDDRGHYEISGLYPGSYIVAVPAALPQSLLAAPADAIGPSAPVRVGGRTVNVPRTSDGRNLAARLMPLPRSGFSTSATRYPVTFAPGVPLASAAAVIRVAIGQGVPQIDIHLTASLTGLISGRVTAGDVGMVRLVPSELSELGLGFEIASSPVSKDGSFVFQAVPFGNYVIQSGSISEYRVGQSDTSFYAASVPPYVRRSSESVRAVSVAPLGTYISTLTFPGVSNVGAAVDVSLEGPTLSDVVVPEGQCARLEGRVRFERPANTRESTTASAALVAEPAGGTAGVGLAQAIVGKDLGETTLLIPCLRPGRYVLRSGSTGWLVKSVSRAGRETVEQAIDMTTAREVSDVVVTMTESRATLTGEVRAGSRRAAAGAVLVFPAQSEMWSGFGLSPARITSVRISVDGRYSVPSLPAGDYFVLALPFLPVAPWQSAPFFRAGSLVATRVHLEWNESRQQDLPMSAQILR